MTNTPWKLARLGIGQAQRAYRMTARALRLYDEIGLVRADRDRSNARYFDAEAQTRLEWIAALRPAGLSLLDLREVLDAEDENGLGRQLAVAKLHARRNELANAIRVLETLTERLAAGFSPAEICLDEELAASAGRSTIDRPVEIAGN